MLQDILQPVAEGFWKSLKQRLADNIFADDVLRHFVHVATYLDDTGGDPRGGFVLDFSVTVGVPLLFGSIDLCGTASYELFLDDAELAARLAAGLGDRLVFAADWTGKTTTFFLSLLILAHILEWRPAYLPLTVLAAATLAASYVSYGSRAWKWRGSADRVRLGTHDG